MLKEEKWPRGEKAELSGGPLRRRCPQSLEVAREVLGPVSQVKEQVLRPRGSFRGSETSVVGGEMERQARIRPC